MPQELPKTTQGTTTEREGAIYAAIVLDWIGRVRAEKVRVNERKIARIADMVQAGELGIEIESPNSTELVISRITSND